MSRARNIKPGFFTNEDLVELPFETRLLFIGLWTLADREGRLEDRPKRIKMAIFPADMVDVDASLHDLHASGFILRYTGKGIRCIQIVNFAKHQNPHHREAASSLPGPDAQDEPETSPGPAQGQPDASRADSLIPDSLIPDNSHSVGEKPTPARKRAREAAAPPSPELPPGLLTDTWKAFRDHRQRLRAPLTFRAEKLLLAKLTTLCADGADPNALVDRSIEHGWKGLFPLNGSRADPADGIRQWLEHSTALEGEFTHDA
jgi:hypothetical protein